MRRLFCALILSLWPALAAAQNYPDHSALEVNDFAGILPDEIESELTTLLADLRAETGIEMAVITLSRQDTYAPNMTLEAFATGLFNDWGVGDKTRNDGIMVLVLPTDRAMRLELGRGFGPDWDRTAKQIVDTAFLPMFREGDYPRGILMGVRATINDIARPFLAGRSAPTQDGASGLWVLLLMLPMFAVVFWHRIQDWFATRRRCPSCGKTGGLSVTRTLTRRATGLLGGLGTRTTRCALCGYQDETEYTTRRRSRNGTGRSTSFGGGSSSGGGASGRW